MSLNFVVSLLCHEARLAEAHAQATNQIRSYDQSIQKAALSRECATYGTLVSFSFLLIDRRLKEGMWFTVKSLAIVAPF